MVEWLENTDGKTVLTGGISSIIDFINSAEPN
jgi:hypothetical protein